MFFFSSRRRHTRWPRDWSSDVCSSDLVLAVAQDQQVLVGVDGGGLEQVQHRFQLAHVVGAVRPAARAPGVDRKSTRPNSSHVAISYAVFCLKKKKKRRMN